MAVGAVYTPTLTPSIGRGAPPFHLESELGTWLQRTAFLHI